MSRNPLIPYIGRFAPSPPGDLHFGSLAVALASYLDARKGRGQWLVRIEDLDPPREVAGSATAIIHDLQQLGMKSDSPVLYQSRRSAAYQSACEQLLAKDLAYWCGCSRTEMPDTGVYPGTCSAGLPAGKKPRSLRLRTADHAIEFEDRIQGFMTHGLATESGDYVIRRADGYFAYQLAVVVDDAYQQITDIIRGADLLDSTPRQIWLQKCPQLPTPNYAHVPVAALQDGQKLSKRIQSDPIGNTEPLFRLRQALQFLGHQPPTLDWQNTWGWALDNWSLTKVPRCYTRAVPGLD
ncbi:MAG: tRNA glutamyl-Q(34) synthetase GluQRS [Xanthomonadales bacterium]|nr:tRNA glutamyl-Q(34) synthetase GluQRS [Xanthomonadales bacterium]